MGHATEGAIPVAYAAASAADAPRVSWVGRPPWRRSTRGRGA